MTDIHMWVGNTAPTTSVRRKVTEEEAVAAGALGSKAIDPDTGEEAWYVFTKQPLPAAAAISHVIIPSSASLVNAVKDIGLGFTGHHSDAPAAWVHSKDEVAMRLVADHLSSLHGVLVPELHADELESILASEAQVAEALASGSQPPLGGGAIQAIGRDMWAQALADFGSYTATSTGTGATTLTDTVAGWTSNQWAGHDVACGGKLATILSNTSTALTVARWETPGSRSGSVASTPGATTLYVIASGQAPATWVALTANSSSPSTGGGDTTLTAEITTSGGGLIRAAASYIHTPGSNQYSLQNTFTANTQDIPNLPVSIAKIGVFQSQNGGRLLFETLLGSAAPLNNSGDNVQITDTVTGT